MRRIAVLISLVLALFMAPVASSAQFPSPSPPPSSPSLSSPPPPVSMAAIGDSISQAADVCCWYGNHPSNSWSTGGASWDGIRSHYERIRALNPGIAGRNHNDSVSGARMNDGPRQAFKAVGQQVRYVTILLGGNDVCTSSPANMTPVATFRSQFRRTLHILKSGLPRRARIFVASIPDVYRLWALYEMTTPPGRSGTWRTSVSPSCRRRGPRRSDRWSGSATSTSTRCSPRSVRASRVAGSTTLPFSTIAFAREDVSKLDYFHPSLAGQADLAAVTWAHSWWTG